MLGAKLLQRQRGDVSVTSQLHPPPPTLLLSPPTLPPLPPSSTGPLSRPATKEPEPLSRACRRTACWGAAMAAWPALVLLLLADWLRSVRPRDFSMTDVVLLHPSTTPHPGGFKCFTCEDAADNYECNRWAPDVYCPKDARYCYTLHVMDRHGDSVSVTKRCAMLRDCLFTGCADVTDNGDQVCSSCCEGNICNVQVPRNQSAAVFSSTSPLLGSGGASATPSCVLVFIAVILAVT